MAMAHTARLTAFVDHVVDVLGTGAEPEVPRITARGVIAGVAHGYTLGNRPHHQTVGEDMHTGGSLGNPKLDISPIGSAASSGPTGIVATRSVQSGQDPLEERSVAAPRAETTPTVLRGESSAAPLTGKLVGHRVPPELGDTLPAVDAAREHFALNCTRGGT